MSLIEDGLYIGGVREASNKKWLDKHKIECIINASKKLPDFFPNSFNYLSLDLIDSPRENIIRVLEKSYRFIRNALLNNKAILVHCHAGISRSVSLVVYFIMKRDSLFFDTALERIKRRRKQANPNYGFKYQLISVTPRVLY